jgi:hypothetical protein
VARALQIGRHEKRKILNPMSMRNASQRKQGKEEMKPNLTKSPKTDYNYTALTLSGLNGCSAKRIANAHSFRQISDDYFKDEARHSFAEEGAFFAVIVFTVAMALLMNVSALAHFVRVIGAA